MKSIQVSILTLGLVVIAGNGWSQPVTTPPPAPPAVAATAPILSPDQLADLVGPIALYPDPMISLILPASTVPTDIVLAARYLEDGKDPSQIDAQNWDDSVKGLARYPDVIAMMNENLDWTNQLGAAVIAQQGDVMNAIQAARAKAHDLGNLQSTPQQQVIVEKTIIQIVPADPQVIYVPTYNPAVVYVQPAPPAAPFITFGAGLALGIWIGGGCDWYHHGIYTHGYWGHNGWNNNNVNINNSTNININNGNNNWHPNGNRPPPRPPYNPNRPGGGQQIPGFKPPPPGGWNGSRPGQGNNGNRPGNGGNNPGNRPGNPGFKPGGNGPGGNNPGGNKPSTRPAGDHGSNGVRPGGGGAHNNQRPVNNTPNVRPGTSNPGGASKKPFGDRKGQPNQGLPSPNSGRGTFPANNGSKGGHAAPAQNRPAPQSRPAPQNRPAPQARPSGGGGNGGGAGAGGGGGRLNRG